MRRDSAAERWTAAVINLAHIFGIATLFGSVLLLDLRMLGAWRQVPLAPLAAATRPLMRTGFAIAIVSGTALISANGSDYASNPFLLMTTASGGLAGVLDRCNRRRADDRLLVTLIAQPDPPLAPLGPT